MDYVGDGPRAQLHQLAVEQPGVAAPDTEYAIAIRHATSDDRPDRGVHSWRVATTGKDSYPLHAQNPPARVFAKHIRITSVLQALSDVMGKQRGGTRELLLQNTLGTWNDAGASRVKATRIPEGTRKRLEKRLGFVVIVDATLYPRMQRESRL